MTVIDGERLQAAVAAICPDIEKRVLSAPPRGQCERRLWWELSCCILSSQVPYPVACAAADRVDECGTLLDKSLRTAEVVGVLEGLLSEPFLVGTGARRYRFPVSRAAQLAGARSVVEGQGGLLDCVVRASADCPGLRAWLVANVPGLGPKQASMFLRNTGFSYELAVLDRHVLRYMEAVGLREPSPNHVGSLKPYERHEAHLRAHAQALGHPVGLLDWAIWIVMRAARGLAAEEAMA